MPVNNKEQLKEKVEAFLNGQPLYDPKEPVKVDFDEGDLCYILYGSDLFSGVGGLVKLLMTLSTTLKTTGFVSNYKK
jgi:hypothetical protein